MASHKASYKQWHASIIKWNLTMRPTCILFSEQQVGPQPQEDEKCGCHRLKNSHSYQGDPVSQNDAKWNSESCTKLIEDKKNFGILYNPYESCLTKVKAVYFIF